MAVNLVINFFLTSYIVSMLGEEANGFIQLANNFVSYASLITIAFNSMAARHMSICFHQNNKSKVQIYYSSIISCNIVITVLFSPVIIFVVGNLSNFLSVTNVNINDLKILFALAFLNFILSLYLTVFCMPMFVTNSIYLQNTMNMARYVLNAIFLLIFFELLPVRIYYVALVTVLLTTVMIPMAIFLKNKLMPSIKFKWAYVDVNAIKDMLLSGIWNTLNQCGSLFMTGFDLLLANIFIDSKMMGILSVSKMMPAAIFSLANTLNNNIAPAVTISWAKEDSKEVLRKLRSSMKISSILVTISIAVFCSFGKLFYSLWTPSLDAKILTELSFLSCMSFIPWAGPQILYNVFTAADKLKMNSVTYLLTGLVNVVTVYVLLKFTKLGVFAIAGVSSILSIVRNLLFTVPYTAKILHLKWYVFYKDVMTSLTCGVINFLIAWIFSKLLIVQSWLMLIMSAGITCVIILFIDLILVLDKTEKKYILNKIIDKIKI